MVEPWNFPPLMTKQESGERDAHCSWGGFSKCSPNQDLIFHSQQCGQVAMQEPHFLPTQGGKHANGQYSVSLPLL